MDEAGQSAQPPPPATRVSDLPRASTVGRYVILDRLGIGGMGAVYSAYDTQLDRRVALKFLRQPANGEEGEEWRQRLMREAQAMARLSHPNVVTVYDASLTDDGRVFIAMEFVEGGTLSQWLKQGSRGWRETLGVMCEAGEGLEAAHRAGIIHRDFKLENVLLVSDGCHPKVTDFGLARAANDAGRLPSSATVRHVSVVSPMAGHDTPPTVSLSTPLTMAGSMLGTPGYMAPEQYGADEETVDERADIFAFCAACYLALYGELPFEGGSLVDIATATLNGRVRAPPASSEVPAWLHRVLLRGLSVTPAARPSTMTELLAELRADPAHRHRRWFAAGALALVALAAVGGVHEVTARRVRACHEAADRLGGVWDGPRKHAAASAFQATGLSYAAGTWARVEHALDAYSSSWTSSAERACLATRARGERSEVAYGLESACLEERLDGLRALVDVLAVADARTVQNALKAAHDLAPLDACSDLDRLSVVSRPPTDPEARARIRALRGEVAAAKALIDAGKPQQGIERLDGSRARIEQTHFGPLVVSWTLLRAEAIEASDPKAAEQAYEEAVVEADANRLDELKAEAAILAGTLDADWLDRYEDAHRWLHLARGSVERLGDPPRLEVWLEIEEGWEQVYRGKKTDLFQRALDHARAAGVDDPRRRASAYAGMAEMAGNLGASDEACEYDRRSVAEFEEAVGAEHPLVAQYLGDLARDQIDAGKPGDALASAMRALRILEADAERGDVTGESHQYGYVEQQMGTALLRLGRAREAIDHLSRARDLLRVTDGGENRGSLAVNNALAEAHRLVGDRVQAAVALDEDAGLEERMRDVDVETADTLVERAKLRLDRGQPEPALDLAQRALALKSKGTPRDRYALADARLVLARALAACGRSLPQSSELAETARDGFLALGDWDRAADATQLLAQLGRTGR